MPKSILQINKFEGGLINYYDARDIPDNASADIVGLMPDIMGKLRIMGKIETHTGVNEGASFAGDFFQPGYGLFAFNADHNISNAEKETKLLALQKGRFLSIYDGDSIHDEEIELTSYNIGLGEGASSLTEIKPIFFYVDGCLRVNDGELVLNPDNGAVKSYKFISKEWFGMYTVASDWYDLTSYIFPPSVNSGSTNFQLGAKNTSGTSGDDGYAMHATSVGDSGYGELSNGSIMLHVAADAGTAGEWAPDAGMKFGASFVYDDGQESPISNFEQSNGQELFISTSGVAANHTLKFKISVGLGESNSLSGEVDDLAFDPRIAGVAIYWVGDSLSMFEDPLYMAYCYFGTKDSDPAYFEGHDGYRETVFDSVNTIETSNGGKQSDSYLEIRRLPSLTYELRTGISSSESTTSARFSSACVVNRRAYIGGVRRVRFLRDTINVPNHTGSSSNALKQCKVEYESREADRMLVSPVNSFDIFPKSSFIDVAINDGEKITALVPYGDRILQFKDKHLYIINVSQDYEYLESDHKYMGVKHPYQVCVTELGVAWVNDNGCFVFNGEEIINTINQRLNSTSISTTGAPAWKSFIGNNGMIGYLQELKQLVIMQDPADPNNVTDSASNLTGDVMIFDMQSGAWSRGVRKVSPVPKSNMVMNYDDTCLFMSYAKGDETTDRVAVYNNKLGDLGEDAFWRLTDIDQSFPSISNCKLTIGSTDITNTFSNTDYLENETFRELVTRKISEKLSETEAQGEILAGTTAAGTPYLITRPANKITSSDTYSGQDLSITNTPTHAAIAVASERHSKSMSISTFKTYDTATVTGPGGATLEGAFNLPGNADWTWLCFRGSSEHDNFNGYNSVPLEVGMIHMSIDLYHYAPLYNHVGLLTNYYQVNLLEDHSNAVYFGDDPSFFTSEPFLNPQKCQLILSHLNGSATGGHTWSYSGNTFDGSATDLYIDTYYGSYGYYSQFINEYEPNALYPATSANGYRVSGDYNWQPNVPMGEDYGPYPLAYLQHGIAEADMSSPDYPFQKAGFRIGFPDHFNWTLNVDGINGSGSEIATSYAANRYINHGGSPDDLIALDARFPSVVFRVTNDVCVITMLGNRASDFSPNQTYTISGSSFSENNLSLKISEAVSFYPLDGLHACHDSTAFDGSTMEAMPWASSDPRPATSWGDYGMITMLIIYKAYQTGDIQVNSWPLMKTGGDHNTVTFTPAANLGVDNSNKTGVATSPSDWTIKFNRDGATASDVQYALSTRASTGEDYRDSYVTFEGDGDSSITSYFSNSLNAAADAYSAKAIATIPKYDYEADSQGTSTLTLSNSGTTITFAGDWSSTTETSGNKDYLLPGDLITLHQSSLSDTHMYRVKSIGVSGSNSFIHIATDATGPGGGTSGGDDIAVRVKDSSGANAADTGFSSGHIKIINTIRTRSNNPVAGESLFSHNAYILQALEITKFNNSYGNVSDSGQGSPIQLITKDYDFGNPSIRKAFYKLIITYKSSLALPIKAAMDGSGAFTVNVGPAGALSASSAWRTDELYFNNDESPRKGRSIQLRIGGVSSNDADLTNFEINDISIVYREI